MAVSKQDTHTHARTHIEIVRIERGKKNDTIAKSHIAQKLGGLLTHLKLFLLKGIMPEASSRRVTCCAIFPFARSSASSSVSVYPDISISALMSI
jgi:hypothetical protein